MTATLLHMSKECGYQKIKTIKTMKKYYTFFFFFMLAATLVAQPEINCDTLYTDPALSEYVLPYAPGKTYTVTQSNCFPNGGHNLTFAYDFNTLIGDTILACRSGYVVNSNDQYADTDWTSGHENNVFIEHPDGTRMRYTHLMQGGALVNPNEQVVQGQAIGISGNSGNTGGFPHLHLAAFNDGTSYGRKNTIPLNFCNTNDPLNDQNLLIQGQSYTAFDKSITAIEENTKMEAISVYPNPSTSELTLEIKAPDFNATKIHLFNTTGQLVYSKNGFDNLVTMKIPVNELPTGIYFLVVKSESGLFTEKVYRR